MPKDSIFRAVKNHLIRLGVCGFFAGITLCLPLWDASLRAGFPPVPAFDFVSFDAGRAGAICLLMLLILCGIFPRVRGILFALLLWLAAMIAMDINRLQPWVWFYILLWLVAIWSPQDDENAVNSAGRLLLAGVYAWSGLQKWQPYFAEDNFGWFCEAFSWTRALASLPALGYIAAGLEMAMGLGLLWPVIRPIAAVGLIFMHVMILLALSPLGHNWNLVVIPWNIVMIVLVYRLGVQHRDRSAPLRRSGAWLPVAFAWLFPIANFVGYWPETLSWKLYANLQPEASLVNRSGASPAACHPSPDIWQRYGYAEGQKLLLDDWATATLGTPLFYSERTFYQLGKSWCACINTKSIDSAGLQLLSVDRRAKKQVTEQIISCRDLLAR